MRKKDKKKLLIGGLILLGIIAVAIVLALAHFPFAVGGYSALSISNVQYDGTSKIRIYGVSNGAEQLSINWNPSDLNSNGLTQQGYSATKSVIGSITLSSQSVDFNILKDTSRDFYILTAYQVGLFDHCENHVPSGFTYVGWGQELTKLDCVAYQSLGTYSTFTGNHIINSNVNFNIDGATGSLTPSSGTNTLTLNDGKTQVEWTGDLNNYNQITSPFQYAVLFQNSQFQKLIDSTSWNSFQTEVSNWKSCVSASGSPSLIGIIQLFIGNYNNLVSCTSTFNNHINLMLVDKTSTYQNSIGETASFTNNALEVGLTIPTTFPTFMITLDASSVGIVPLKGVPKITSCVSTQNINSGDTTHPSLTVQNTGTSPGSFYGNVQCSGSATASGIISETYFDAGETKNLPIAITGQNTQSGTQSSSCTATVMDRKSGASDSCGFGVNVAYQSGVICTANSVFCRDSNYLRTCSSDGKTFTDTLCANGCVVSETGISSCSNSSGGGGGGGTTCADCEAFAKSTLLSWAFPSTKCESPRILGIAIMGGLTCVFDFIKLILVAIVFIFASLFGFGLFDDILSQSVKNEKVRKTIAVILCLIIGFLLALLTYFIFWTGVIVFAVYILIKILIGIFLKKK